ncbi:hypothetical protein [Bacillus bingmayongensis]|nr:hypothetical protein [Bacillus bingmayongensis]
MSIIRGLIILQGKLGLFDVYTNVKTIIEHAWNWHQSKPHGYAR